MFSKTGSLTLTTISVPQYHQLQFNFKRDIGRCYRQLYMQFIRRDALYVYYIYTISKQEHDIQTRLFVRRNSAAQIRSSVL